MTFGLIFIVQFFDTPSQIMGGARSLFQFLFRRCRQKLNHACKHIPPSLPGERPEISMQYFSKSKNGCFQSARVFFV